MPGRCCRPRLVRHRGRIRTTVGSLPAGHCGISKRPTHPQLRVQRDWQLQVPRSFAAELASIGYTLRGRIVSRTSPRMPIGLQRLSESRSDDSLKTDDGPMDASC